MTFDDSLKYSREAMGIHPWTGYSIHIVTLQHMPLESRHDLARAKEFARTQTKEHIAKLQALTTSSIKEGKWQQATPASPIGWGMIRVC